MEAYIDVKTSTESMIWCGVKLIRSHIQFTTGALKDAPSEIAIYVRDMDDDELDAMQEKAEKVVLKRWDKNGTRMERDLHCRNYEGTLYATGKAMQAIDIQEIKVDPGLGFDVHWSTNEIEGVQRECLMITNISETLGKLSIAEKEISLRINLGEEKVEAEKDF